MAKDKIKVRLPKPDPRYGSDLGPAIKNEMIRRGEAMDVRDHPARNVPDATEHHAGTVLGDTFSALGPDASDAVMTSQMDKSNEISQAVPRRAE